MNSARKPKILIAGDFAPDLEDAIFRESRLSGAQCARVSGLDAWEKMLERCRFDAVILGLPEERPEPDVQEIPGVEFFVVSNNAGDSSTRMKACYCPDSFRQSLPAIISRIKNRRSSDGSAGRQDHTEA